MKLVLIGGHLSPLLAVLCAAPKEWEILVVGRKYTFEGDSVFSLEYQTMRDMHISFSPLTTGRLQRIFTRHTLFSLAKIPYGFFQSFFILKKFQPDVVLSFGGYLSFPVTLAAFFLGIPVVIHEQTFGAGMANKIASWFAKKICISWEPSRKFFPKEKTVLTGNPIRQYKVERLKLKVSSDEKIPLIYITGGSAGSHAINLLVEKNLDELLNHYRVIHQTGDAKKYGDFERLSQVRNKLPEKKRARYMPVKFVEPEEVSLILLKAALVISRAGVNTVSELIHFKKPSLLIPLPHAGRSEQIENAEFFKNSGLGEIFFQDEPVQKFVAMIFSMLKNLKDYRVKKTIQIPDLERCADKIVDVVQSVYVAAKKDSRGQGKF